MPQLFYKEAIKAFLWHLNMSELGLDCTRRHRSEMLTANALTTGVP